ncbi:helix-turn-helix domain-containing protein [Clostridium baratii]|uniref:helix-turn-helix domain-containing protein n=1 Tax=Clostridium baratii TaxID=1561 RepID=UPI0030D59ED2
MKTISERLKEALEIRDMKQTDLVKLTGITKGALSSYISGAYEPKQRNIHKLSQALNVDETWLMGFDVPMNDNLTNPNSTTSIINYNLEQYIENLGFRITGDEAEGYLFLTTKDTEYEISLSDLNDLENTTKAFIKFKLSEIIDKSRKFNNNNNNNNNNISCTIRDIDPIVEDDGYVPRVFAAHSDGIDEETNRRNIEMIKRLELEKRRKKNNK